MCPVCAVCLCVCVCICCYETNVIADEMNWMRETVCHGLSIVDISSLREQYTWPDRATISYLIRMIDSDVTFLGANSIRNGGSSPYREHLI